MSIKRTRQVSRGRRREDYEEKKKIREKQEQKLNWKEAVQGQPDHVFIPYSQSGKYEKGNFLLHHVFGKGIIVAVEGNKIDVLFEDGVKKLIQGTVPSGDVPKSG